MVLLLHFVRIYRNTLFLYIVTLNSFDVITIVNAIVSEFVFFSSTAAITARTLFLVSSIDFSNCLSCCQEHGKYFYYSANCITCKTIKCAKSRQQFIYCSQ